MFSPLLRLLLREPALLAEHLDAYGDLVERNWDRWRASLRRRALLWIVAAVTLALAVVFLGVSLMLWATTESTHWALWAVPGVPAVLSLGAAVAAKSQRDAVESLGSVSSQFRADLKMLKETL